MERKLASVEDMKYYMHVMPNLFKAWSRKSGWQLVAMRFNLSSADQDDFKLLEKAFSSFDFNVEEINQIGVDKMIEKIKGVAMKLTESQLRRIIREEIGKVPDPITNIPYYDSIDDDVDIDSLDSYDLADYYEKLQRMIHKIPPLARYQDQENELRKRLAMVRARGESM